VEELIIERFNGKEVYRISEAKLRCMKENGYLETVIEVKTDAVIQGLEDTTSLNARPTAEIIFKVIGEDLKIFDNYKTYIPHGFSHELQEYLTTFCYASHQMMNDNRIRLSFDGKKHFINWTSKIMDVNYYDGSVTDAKVTINSSLIIEESTWTCIKDLKLVIASNEV
jgi:hypothetical protein